MIFNLIDELIQQALNLEPKLDKNKEKALLDKYARTFYNRICDNDLLHYFRFCA